MTPQSHVIGIDIGGTKTAVAVLNGEGKILARGTLPTEAERGFERAVERLIETGHRLLHESGSSAGQLTGIGIGCAGPVDPARGLINNPYTLSGWNRCDIVTPLQTRFGCPVYLENDADMAALGECFLGAGRGGSPVVMLTFGTGIGGAVVINGQIYRGVSGEHPELGHVPVTSDGPNCYCGTKGCFESLASGTAISEAGRSVGLADARQVFASASRGDAAACCIVVRALDAAATATWTILRTFLPQRLVLGGGIIEEHFELFAVAVNRSLSTASMVPRDQIAVAQAELGNDAGLVGAVSLLRARTAAT